MQNKMVIPLLTFLGDLCLCERLCTGMIRSEYDGKHWYLCRRSGKAVVSRRSHKAGKNHDDQFRLDGQAVCPACLGALNEAVELVQGGFLVGFTLPDSLEFDAGQALETGILRRGLAGALLRLPTGGDL